MNITDMPDFVNLSKLTEYNETVTLPTSYTFTGVLNGIFEIFSLYPILQWFILILTFFVIYLTLRYSNAKGWIDKTDMQLIAITSFVLIAMNGLLLIFNIFTELAILEMFVIIWLISVIPGIIKKQ